MNRVLMSESRSSTPSIVIVGAGFAGIAAAIRLKQAGIEDFVIYEQSPRVGGVWWENDYPGCACDVPSHLYSFSFELNPDWTRRFAPQAEIQAYLERCADKYDLRRHLRLNTQVIGADFDEGAGRWRVRTSGPAAQEGELQASFLILGTGGINQPARPDLPGLSSFRGKVMHSARWDHSVPLDGKNVAIVGTGASAIQIVPAIVERVARLLLFQRTPAWIVPKPDGDISPSRRAAYKRWPWLQRLARSMLYWQRELLAIGFFALPGLLHAAELAANWYRRRHIRDPELRAKLTPRYRMGCKRILPTNDYYPAVARPNVELITGEIAEVRPNGIVGPDGRERPADVIVLATGFQVAEAPPPFAMRGKGGLPLEKAWQSGAEAYLGTTVSGFPNAFILVGPNTGLGHTSMILMIESQVQYVVSCLKLTEKKGIVAVDVAPAKQAAYNRWLQKRLSRSVWNTGGCMSWYLSRTGRNTTLWPGFTFEFRFKTRRFRPQGYELTAAETVKAA
jgi:cation diffusion facilitator CzcD-associated flavoprotein CzcO